MTVKKINLKAHKTLTQIELSTSAKCSQSDKSCDNFCKECDEVAKPRCIINAPVVSAPNYIKYRDKDRSNALSVVLFKGVAIMEHCSLPMIDAHGAQKLSSCTDH